MRYEDKQGMLTEVREDTVFEEHARFPDSPETANVSLSAVQSDMSTKDSKTNIPEITKPRHVVHGRVDGCLKEKVANKGFMEDHKYGAKYRQFRLEQKRNMENRYHSYTVNGSKVHESVLKDNVRHGRDTCSNNDE